MVDKPDATVDYRFFGGGKSLLAADAQLTERQYEVAFKSERGFPQTCIVKVFYGNGTKK